jgi:hypothetical protein
MTLWSRWSSAAAVYFLVHAVALGAAGSLRQRAVQAGKFSGLLTSVGFLSSACSHLGLRPQIAGLIAGLPFFWLQVKLKLLLGLFVLVQGLKRPLSKRLSLWQWEALFAGCQIPIMSSFLLNNALLPAFYSRWIHRMGNVSPDRLQLVLTAPAWQELDYLHRTTIRAYFAKETSRLLVRRCIPLYLKAHLLGALLREGSTRKNWCNLPRNVLRSSAFLTSYVSLAKLSVLCLNRWYRCVFPANWWFGTVTGLLTGLSVKLEAASRRRDLALYCLPHALHVVVCQSGLPSEACAGFAFLVGSAFLHAQRAKGEIQSWDRHVWNLLFRGRLDGPW